jgi:hypothetical protein
MAKISGRTEGRTKGATSNLRSEAERSIQKGRYKDAVKQAQKCYREEATPENHWLLERAYFHRARELWQRGLESSAVEVAERLLAFGVTRTDFPEQLGFR